MKTRIITAIAIIICVVPPLLFGGWMITALLAFIVIGGGLEVLGLKEQKEHWPFLIKVAAIASVFVIIYAPEVLRFPMLGMAALVFLSIPVFTEHFQAKDAFLCIAYITIFVTIASSFLVIYTMDRMAIWFIIIATYGCDTGAYFCGRFLGKHKLNVRISPKKTWEGAIGGWILGAILSFAFAYFFVEEMSMPMIMMGSLLLTITGQIGDLAFSAIKRSFGIKDFSNLLPGHGGVLDRVDSLVFNFICFHLILVVLNL